jgi:hypothetical protein
MLLGKSDSVIGHPPEYMAKVSKAHLEAYMPGDIETLMKSVSPNGGIWAGMAPPHGATLLRSNDEIRSTYTDLLNAIQLGNTKIFVLIATDWYVFFESVATVTDKASGTTLENQSVGLFGADDHALAVDMAWPFGIEPGAVRPSRDLGGRVRSELLDLTAHEQRISGLNSENADLASTGIIEESQLFLPCFDPADQRLELLVSGVSAYKDYLAALWAIYRIDTVVNLNMSIGDQYVFSEYLLKVTDRGSGNALEIRYALVEILAADGKVKGMLGYATQS